MQRLQRGFAGPIGPHEPLPGLLPAGYSDGARLLGPGPAGAMGWLVGSGPSPLSDTK